MIASVKEFAPYLLQELHHESVLVAPETHHPPQSKLRLNVETLEQRDVPAIVTLNTLVVTQGQNHVEITLNRDSDFGLQQSVSYTFGVTDMYGTTIQMDPGTVSFSLNEATSMTNTHYLPMPFDPMDMNFYSVNIIEDPANNIYTTLPTSPPPVSPPPVTSPIAIAIMGDTTNTVGEPVNVQVVASGNPNATYTYSAMMPFPTGLSIDSATGVISGTFPPEYNMYAMYGMGASVTVGVAGSDGSSTTAIVNFVLYAEPPLTAPIEITLDGDTYYTVGDSVSIQATATGTPGATYTYFASNLPPGLSIDMYTGLITGTLTQASSSPYTFTISVVDSNAIGASADFEMEVGYVHPTIEVIGDTINIIGQPVNVQVVATGPVGTTYNYSANNFPY